MTETVLKSNQAIDNAVMPLIRGDGSAEFFNSASTVLKASSNYYLMLRDAELVGLDRKSVHAGVIAGLKIAAGLLNVNMQF